MALTANPMLDKRDRKYGWTTLPLDQKGPEPPALIGQHTARGEALWDLWWSTPIATIWAPWDGVALERLLDAYELWWIDRDQKILAVILAIEDRFGLTPTGRRKLFIQIEGVDVPSKTPTRRASGLAAAGPGIPSAGGTSDPRLRLLAGGKGA